MRSKGEEIVGRFHFENGISSIDPFENYRIIGEIQLFKIENPYEYNIPENT